MRHGDESGPVGRGGRGGASRPRGGLGVAGSDDGPVVDRAEVGASGWLSLMVWGVVGVVTLGIAWLAANSDPPKTQHVERLCRGRASWRSLAFDSTGSYLVGADSDGGLHRFDLESGRVDHWVHGRGPRNNSVVISPDDSTVACADHRGVISLYDATTGRVRSRIEVSGLGRIADGEGRSPVLALAYASEGRTLVSGSADGVVRLWDAIDGHLQAQLAGHTAAVTHLSIGSKGRILGSASLDGTAKIWDRAEGRCLKTFSKPGSRIHALALSPDEQILALSLGAYRGKLHGEVFLVGLGPDPRPDRSLGEAAYDELAFSPDGLTLISAGRDKVVRLFDVAGGQIRTTLGGHEGYISCIAVSPDGRKVATGGEDRLLGLVNLPTTTF